MIPREKLALDFTCAMLSAGVPMLTVLNATNKTVIEQAFDMANEFQRLAEKADKIPLAAARPFRPGGTEK